MEYKWKGFEKYNNRPVSMFGNIKWKIKRWFKKNCDHRRIIMCNYGFHVVNNIRDLYSYMNRPQYISACKVSGQSHRGMSKEAWQNILISEIWELTPELCKELVEAIEQGIDQNFDQYFYRQYGMWESALKNLVLQVSHKNIDLLDSIVYQVLSQHEGIRK